MLVWDGQLAGSLIQQRGRGLAFAACSEVLTRRGIHARLRIRQGGIRVIVQHAYLCSGNDAIVVGFSFFGGSQVGARVWHHLLGACGAYGLFVSTEPRANRVALQLTDDILAIWRDWRHFRIAAIV